MRLGRLLSTTVVVGVAATATFLACGGDDGHDGDHTHDAAAIVDAKIYEDAPRPIDAAITTMGLGQPCTPPMTGSGQGTCPAGYTCLDLTGPTGPWCSKTCTRGSNDMCSVGYTGPGFALCYWDITFAGSSAVHQYCGVKCADKTGTCGAKCNNTCPGTMACTETIKDGSGATVGSACE